MKSYVVLLFVVVVSFTQTEGAVVGTLPNFQHGIQGTLQVLNTNQLFIQGFSYDGLGPAAFIYYYPPGSTANRFGGDGVIINVPGGSSDGRFTRRYNNEDLTIDLPDGINACDIGTFTIWCRAFSVFFTTLVVPSSTFANDGADPCTLMGDEVTAPPIPTDEFDNCMFLDDSFQLSWSVNWPEEEINFRVCGCRADTSVNQYLGFGLSGNMSYTYMIGADVTIAWVDSTDGSVNAVDYYLNGRTQCRGGVGACPDEVIANRTCTNDVTLMSGGALGRTQCVLFKRSFRTADDACDISIDPNNTQQYIVWAVGGLGETAFVHFIRADPTSSPIHLGRSSLDQCQGTTLTCQSCDPFEGQRMMFLEDTTFIFQIGASGGERGYMGITGRPGWGIAWYVNGTLIPELVLRRGRTYTFIVEGGTDTSILARYHPLYITDSIGGGRLQNTEEVRAEETVFAGFDTSGTPTGVGRLCEKLETDAATNTRESCGLLEAYQNALTTSCESGNPGTFTWTPSALTPNVVYYQCATHLNLGWKITIVNGAPSVTGTVFTLSILVLLVLSLVA